MSSVIFKTRCTKGQLIVYEDKVSIELNGFGVRNENSLIYDQITGVQLKTTSIAIPLVTSGIVTVEVFGSGDQKLIASMVKGKDGKTAKELIESRIGKNTPQQSGLNDLEKLSELKDKGIISQEEFEQKKKQLLGL